MKFLTQGNVKEISSNTIFILDEVHSLFNH